MAKPILRARMVRLVLSIDRRDYDTLVREIQILLEDEPPEIVEQLGPANVEDEVLKYIHTLISNDAVYLRDRHGIGTKRR